MLLKQAAQASRRAAFLRGEYFVRTGTRLCPPESCALLGDTLHALREGMMRDDASADAYRRLAARTDDGELRAVLERFSAEVAAAAQRKRCGIRRRFA